MAIAMASEALVLLSALFVAIAVKLLLRRSSSKTSHLPPAPPGLPFIGNMHQIGGGTIALHQALWQLSIRHGPIFSLKLGVVRAVVISSAELAKEVLKTKDLDLCSRPKSIPSDLYTLNGKGIVFAPYGDRWREVKKLSIIELFSVKKVRSFSAVREEEISAMLQAIGASAANDHASPGAAVNLSGMVTKLTFNFICRVAFGGRYQLEEDRLHRLLNEAQDTIIAPYFGDFFPMLWWVDWVDGKMRRIKKNTEDLFALVGEFIANHLNGEKAQPEQEEDIVDVLLRNHKEGNLTMEDIKALILDIFFGGIETSLSAVIWTLAELIRHPAAMKRAQDEVREVIGAKGKVEEADITQLQYLLCAIKESFRLHPPVPLLPQRESMRQTSIAGYDVPQGTRVFVNVWAIGRDPKAWEEPNEFIPERFMDAKHEIDYKGKDFELITFGSGRRICPGMHLGTTTVEHVLANLLYWFDWRVPDGMKSDDINMDEALGLIVQKKIPLQLVPIKPKLG